MAPPTQRHGARLAAIARQVTAGGAAADGGITAAPTADDGGRALFRSVAGVSEALDRHGLLRTPWAQQHLQWMAQKDALGQDMFLIGPSGPLRRWLALCFAEAMGREVEVVSLTQDTTESDLKQRREIGRGGTMLFIDQAAVQAALSGRVLIIEGLEKVERNVLPVINNLLENREMHLEDGRFLVAPGRYDTLARAHGTAHLRGLRLERVSPTFRVVALGVPVPPFPGNPLDPPLRSRFQARRIDPMPAPTLLRCLLTRPRPRGRGEEDARPASLAAGRHIQEVVAAYAAVWELGEASAATSGGEGREVAYEKLIYPSEVGIASAARLLEEAPETTVADALHRAVPAAAAITDAGAKKLLMQVIPPMPPLHDEMEPHPTLCAWQAGLVDRMRGSLAIGRDVLLVGPRGSGKSTTAQALLAEMGYRAVTTLTLFKDMTSRDLLQSRATTSEGETIWCDSSVARAARLGRAVILDGVDRLAPGTLSALGRLLEDREAVLFDGTQLMNPSRLGVAAAAAGLKPEQLLEKYAAAVVHPDFRVIALATTPDAKNAWLSNEIAHMFHTFSVGPARPADAAARPLGEQAAEDAGELLRRAAASVVSSVPSPPRGAAVVGQLSDLAKRLAQVRADGGVEVAGLSARQMLRLLRWATHFPQDLSSRIADALLVDFLPVAERAAVREVLQKWPGRPRPPGTEALKIDVDEAAGFLHIGETSCEVGRPEHPALVPDIVFFNVPMHTRLLESMLRDYTLGEHLLLIGNQGVGKNKLADRFLQLMRLEREFVQLHRDTTVQALTLLPSLQGGVVKYDDSPLVRALQCGRILVVDEFDKAPTEVVCVLKSLLEDGEVQLVDGRRFVDQRKSVLDINAFSPEEQKLIHPVHHGFRMIALANRPGFPFLGNDFFREMGDVFAVHAVGNPDLASEVALLQSYGPHVPQALISKLAAAFAELRRMADEGLVSYPYSTREVVNIVRHLERFPTDPITQVVENVFGFDFDADLRRQLFDIFRRHGIPLINGTGGRAPNSTNREYANAAEQTRQLVPQEMPTALHACTLMPGASVSVLILPPTVAAKWAPGRMQREAIHVAETSHWRPLSHAVSARVERFSEEIVGWDVGGGEPVALVASGRSVFVLTSEQEIRQYDLEMMRWRIHDLHLARFSSGRHFGLACSGEWVVTYSEHHGALHVLRAFAESVGPPAAVSVDLSQGLDLSFGRHVKIVALPAPLQPCFAMFRGGTSLLVLFCPRTFEIRRLALSPHIGKGGIDAVEVLGSSGPSVSLLVKSGGAPRRAWRLTLTLSLSAVASPLAALGDVAALEPFDIVGDFQDCIFPGVQQGILPPVVGSLSLDDGPAAEGCHAVGGENGLLCGFATGLAGQARAQLFAWPRSVADLHSGRTPLLRDDEATPTLLRKRRASVWLAGAQLVCVVTSSPLAVVVEVVDVVGAAAAERSGGEAEGAVFWSFPLAKDLTQAMPFVAPPEKHSDAHFLRSEGMPHVVNIAEIPGEGTVAVLLSNGQVRVLELRPEHLAESHKLWRQMVEGARSEALAEEEDEAELDGESDETEGEGEDEQGADLEEESGEEDGDTQRRTGDSARKARRGRGSVGRRGAGGRGGRGGSGGVGGRGGRGRGGFGGTGFGGIGGAFKFQPGAVRRRARAGAAGGPGGGRPRPAHSWSQEEGDDALQQARERAREVAEWKRLGGALSRRSGAVEKAVEYERIYGSVRQEIAQLRVVLAAAEAKERERTWLRNQPHGELDESRLVDGIAGERSIFRRRGRHDRPGLSQRLPKRLTFVVDVSSSMTKMNADGRLDRAAATVVLVMEAFAGFEARFSYDIVGHSGETDALELIPKGRPPSDARERFKVVEHMFFHSSGCMSGDSTLSATIRAVREVAKDDADDRFVFVISDANLAQYGVGPQQLASALQESPLVNTFMFIIAEEDEAEEVRKAAPPGRVFRVMDTSELPGIFRRIFAAAVLRDV